MSQRALRKIWSFCGFLAFAFAGFALLRTTGSSAPDSILPLATYGPYGVTLLALPLGSVLTLVVLWLTRRHAGRVEGEDPSLHGSTGRWATRLPVFFFEPEDIDPSTRDGRLYQGLFLAGFILWPAVAQVFLFAKLWRGRADLGGGSVSGWRHLVPGRDLDWST